MILGFWILLILYGIIGGYLAAKFESNLGEAIICVYLWPVILLIKGIKGLLG